MTSAVSTSDHGRPYVAGHGGVGHRSDDVDDYSPWPLPRQSWPAISDGTGAVSADGRGGARRAAESVAPAPVPSLQVWPHVSILELTALPTAVACGRLHTRQVLWEWKLDTFADDAEVLASQLMNNSPRDTG